MNSDIDSYTKNYEKTHGDDTHTNTHNNISSDDRSSLLFDDKNLLNKALESSINGIIIADLDGNICYANSSFYSLWDIYNPDEVIGHNLLKFWRSPGKTMSILDKVFEKGYWIGQIKGIKKDRREFDLKISIELIDEDKEPTAICATFFDISEMINFENKAKKFNEELEESYEQLILTKEIFHFIVGKSVDAILVLDEEGVIKFANESAKKMLFKNSNDELTGQLFGIPTVGKNSIEIYVPSKNKNEHGVGEMVVSETKWDNNNAYLVQIRDISDHKRIQRELEGAKMLLKHTNVGLEEEVKKRTKKIENLLKQKDEFIGQLGHDLKTPISILLNIIPMIKDEISDEEVIKDCDLAIRNTKYIKNLVIQTLRLANLSSENQSFDINKSSLQDIVHDAIEDNKSIFDKKNIKIKNNIDDLLICSDELRLKEVFTNLLNNAVKFMLDGGTITLNAWKDENYTTISISDTGQGMTENQLENIFDEFYKADISRHELDSSGLGLSICKRIIEKHGGRIWAESKGVGKGSTFYFTIPNK